MAISGLYPDRGESRHNGLFVQQPAHVEIDLTGARRVFVFGDVHGYIANVNKAMAKVGYDAAAGDRMIGLGDWLDRGEDTMEIADFIAEHRNDLAFVKGNHEQILEDNFTGRPGGFGPDALISNGGAWVLNIIDMESLEDDEDAIPQPNENGRRLLSEVCGAPIALTLLMPSGKKVGIVHAEVRRAFGRLDWNDLVEKLEEEGPEGSMADEVMWGRQEIKMVQKAYIQSLTEPGKAKSPEKVTNIDHVFHGHTIVKNPVTWGNRSWIDIGSFAGPEIAFIDIDNHI